LKQRESRKDRERNEQENERQMKLQQYEGRDCGERKRSKRVKGKSSKKRIF
jgi:hypothetical protein